MNIRFDHLLIRVENLKETVSEFQEMGFKVYYGNSKSNCHHAMVYFEDESFIEFIDQSAFPNILKILSKKNILNFFGPFFRRISLYVLSPNRFLDYSLYSSNIEQLYKHSKTKAIVSKQMNLKRTNHLRDKIMWKLFAFDDIELPFIMSDYYPKKYPEENATRHPNGIKGMKRIRITCKSVSSLVKKFEIFFTLKASELNILALKNTEIEFIQGEDFEIVSLILESGRENAKYNYSYLEKYKINSGETLA